MPSQTGSIDLKAQTVARDNAVSVAASDATSKVETEANQRKAQYGTCSTAAGTAAKVVTCSNFALYTGARIVVKFTTANTAAAPTLNVNSTGAKAIWNANAVASATNPVLWGANATLTFVYDGTEFVLEDKAPSYSIACSTAAATAAKAATVTGALVVNGTVVQALFSTANTVSAAITFNLSATGAATIYRNRAATSASNTLTWTANTVLTLVRNAQYWYLADNGTRTMSEDAAKTATNYITQVDSNGITIHPSSGTTNRTSINADGMTIYQNDVDVANFGATARIGQASGDRVVVDSTNGVTIYKGTTKRLQTTSDGLAVFDDQNTAIATFGIGSAQLPGMALGDNTEIYYISDNDENALIMSVDSTTENKEARTALYAESSQSSVLQDCMSEIAADADSSKDHYASASLAVWNHYNSANNRKYAFISVAVDDDQGSLASISADALAIFNGDVSIEKNVYANKKLEVYQSLSAQNILIDRSINNYSGYAINATGKHSFSSAAPSSGDVADLVLVNYDSDESLIGYMQIVNTTDGVYRSFVVQNPRTLERTGLYAKAFDDGTSEVFTSSGTLLRSYTLQATNRVYSHGGLGGIGGDSDYYYFVDSTNGNLFRFNKTTGMIHFKRDGSWAVRNSCITAVVSSALSLTEDWATVTLSSNVSHGGELTISSGGVKCARAGTVKVSANCYISGMNGDNVGNAAIYKGSTSVAVASQRQLNDRVDLAITPKLISVSANDVLYLKARNTSSSTGSVTVSATMTYMTVEYIN